MSLRGVERRSNLIFKKGCQKDIQIGADPILSNFVAENRSAPIFCLFKPNGIINFRLLFDPF